MDQRINDLEIQALVDGEVDDPKSVELMTVMTKDRALYNRYLLYKKQKSILKSWWKDN